MPEYKAHSKETLQSECENPARFLSWESGKVRSLEHALTLCDEVETCQLNCKCGLRDAYHFYLNEAHKS